MTKFNSPFNPADGIFAENVRASLPPDDGELRAALKKFGWVKQFPALADENDVVLVGHRRMAIAKELGIEPVIVKLKLGKGDEADAERLKLAIVSNIGGKPLTAADRKRIAQYLYGKDEWTEQRIANALNVGFSTIQRDLGNLPAAGKLKPAKTASNPKGAGRPKGSKAEKPPSALRPKTTDDRDEKIVALSEAGCSRADIAAEVGVTERTVRRALDQEQLRQEGRAEPTIDPSTLSATAQQKLEAAIRAHKAKLDASFQAALTERARKHLEDVLLRDANEKIAEAKELFSRRQGLMDKDTFNTIRRALHPDSRHSISDQKLAAAFDAFMALEKYLLDEKDSPTEFPDLPRTWQEWEERKRQATAARKSQRANRSALRPRA